MSETSLRHEDRPASFRQAEDSTEDRDQARDLERILFGVRSGVLGAFVVAVVFLGVDLAAGRPLWTPHLLGSALFLREAPADAIRPVLVLGYTLTHGAVFVALGLLAASALPFLSRARARARAPYVLGGLGLFVLMQIVFALFSAVFLPQGGPQLPIAWVSVANLAAAASMTAYLARGARGAGAR